MTAFFSPSDKQFKPTDFYFNMFEILVSTGIKIILYLDNKYKEKGEELLSKYNNLQIFYNSFEQLKKDLINHSNHSYNNEDFVLPLERNTSKDTLDYYYIQLSKLYHLSLYSKYSKDNQINETHLAWIDFGIFYLFDNIEKSYNLLDQITKLDLPKNTILSPGSKGWDYDIFYQYYKDELFNKISWFVCGSFIIGDINLFDNLYKKQMDFVYKNLPKITWEVNYWTMIYSEKNSYNFVIYKDCNHNESMLSGLINYVNYVNKL